jgi:hypothetical protein
LGRRDEGQQHGPDECDQDGSYESRSGSGHFSSSKYRREYRFGGTSPPTRRGNSKR